MKRNNTEDTTKNSTGAQLQKMKKDKSGVMKEEISLELAELDNLNPTHEPMTPNQREKSESEKTYK